MFKRKTKRFNSLDVINQLIEKNEALGQTLSGHEIRVANASALKSIGMVSRFYEKRVDIDELKQHYMSLTSLVDPLAVVRGLSDGGLKAGIKKRSWKALQKSTLPLILILRNGHYAVLMKMGINEALIQFSDEVRSKSVSENELSEIWDGAVVLVVNRKSEEKEEKFGFRWFAKTFLKYRPIMRDTILASFFIQIFGLISPLIFMIVIDKVLSHNSLSTLDVLVFAMVVMMIFEIILTGLRTYLVSHTSNRIDLELGIRLFRHMLSLPLSYFEARRVGDTIARVRELETIRQFITGSGLTLMIDIFFVFIFIFVMFLFSPLLTIIVLCALPLFFLVSWFLTPMLRSKLEDKYKLGAENQSFLVETVGAMETIKSSAVEGKVLRDWEHHMGGYVKSAFHSGQLSNYTNSATTLISKTLTVMILFFGAKQVMAGNITVGQLIAFNMLASRVNAPILRLAQIWKEFQGMRVSIRRIADILDTSSENGKDGQKTALPDIDGNIEFDHVTFRYRQNGPIILNEISFSVSAGEVVGVVGSSGSGKTTLIKLLQRLYIPEQGRVLIDGIDIARVDPNWLRRQIGVVSQDNILFNRTVRENISFADPLMEDDEIIKVAKLVGAHQLILSLPEGYDTVIGERGSNLSAGQRQRIALARALSTNPTLLILDEATSALDSESEMIIQDKMQDICKGRTVFIVAHRLSTLRSVNRILTIEDGELVENGNPQELSDRDGRFAKLSQLQQVN